MSLGIIPSNHHEIYGISFPYQNQATKATEFGPEMKEGIDTFTANNGAGILLHILPVSKGLFPFRLWTHLAHYLTLRIYF